MVRKQLIGICAVAMLVVLAAACGCTGTSDDSQSAAQPQEGMGTPQVNGTAPEQREQPPMNGTAPEGREQPQMGFASAAAALGVTEEELRTALGEPGQEQNTFADAAAELGVSEEALIEALGVPEGMTEGGTPGGREGGAPPESQ
ncbi:MAG: hypothetical protein M0P22_05810 [Methanoculleus sp.]|nr:hypothetical protein [Methanoculleus sp.]